MGKLADQNKKTDGRDFNDPDWSVAMALAWITLPNEFNVNAVLEGRGDIGKHAIDDLMSSLKDARQGLFATGQFEGEKFSRRLEPQDWIALTIDIHKYTPPSEAKNIASPVSQSFWIVTVRSTVLHRQLGVSIMKGGGLPRYATVEGVSVPSATIKKLFSAPMVLTAKAETNCKSYLIQLMNDSPERAPKPKPDIRAECLIAFPGLSRRAFDRQWANAISASGVMWGQSGRRKNSSL